ncbi:PREDICTED: uncharacterized protein LOC106817365 [Priapulus caudatus]|uniref:Uncharacterized protein LOC106817365 n=1 Tax=Priapulus caudatus TaxID=37621 RepID=A0ABM1EZ90_PRICU|nr:PREDICTED: uncharacterized protein LOC106817365 [Priapulus caudatus]
MSQWPSPDSHAQAYANPRSNESGDTGFSSNPGSNDPSTQECFSPMSNASGDTGVGSNPGDLSSVGDNLMWNQVPVLCNAVSNSLQFVGNPGSNNSVSFANSAVSSAVVYINTGHSDPASYGNFGANTPVGHTVTGQSNPASMSNWSPDTAVANTNNTETSNPASYPNFNLETLDVLLATIGVEEFASAPELTDNMMHPEMPRNVTPNFLGSQVESYSLMTDVVTFVSPSSKYVMLN